MMSMCLQCTDNMNLIRHIGEPECMCIHSSQNIPYFIREFQSKRESNGDMRIYENVFGYI